MVRLFIIVICLVSANVNAQNENYIRSGLIATSLTFSPSIMLNQNKKNAYLMGFVEGYLDENISFRGEGNFLITGLDETPYYNQAFRTTFGMLAHVNKNNLDAHLGLMPGVFVAELNGNQELTGEQVLSIAPVISLHIGGSFYMWKFAHIFLNATYTSTNYTKLNRGVYSRADELMFSAGLGFNINAIKPK